MPKEITNTNEIKRILNYLKPEVINKIILDSGCAKNEDAVAFNELKGHIVYISIFNFKSLSRLKFDYYISVNNLKLLIERNELKQQLR